MDKKETSLNNSEALEKRFFVVGVAMAVVTLGLLVWAFGMGDLTEAQIYILQGLLPICSGFLAGSFVGALTVKTNGLRPGIVTTATGGFGVFLLMLFLWKPADEGTFPFRVIFEDSEGRQVQVNGILTIAIGAELKTENLGEGVTSANFPSIPIGLRGKPMNVKLSESRFTLVANSYRFEKGDNTTLIVSSTPEPPESSQILFEGFEDLTVESWLGDAEDWVGRVYFYANSISKKRLQSAPRPQSWEQELFYDLIQNSGRSFWTIADDLYPVEGAKYLRVAGHPNHDGERGLSIAGEAIRTFVVSEGVKAVELKAYIKGSGISKFGRSEHKSDIFIRLADKVIATRLPGRGYFGASPGGAAEIRLGMETDNGIYRDGISGIVWKTNLKASDSIDILTGYDAVTRSSTGEPGPIHIHWYEVSIRVDIGRSQVKFSAREKESSGSLAEKYLARSAPWQIEAGKEWSFAIGSGSGIGWIDSLEVREYNR